MLYNHRDILIILFYYILLIYLYVKLYTEAASAEWHKQNRCELHCIRNGEVHMIIILIINKISCPVL